MYNMTAELAGWSYMKSWSSEVFCNHHDVVNMELLDWSLNFCILTKTPRSIKYVVIL